MNRHLTMMLLCLFVVIPLAATLPIWAAVIQAAVGGMSFGAHGTMWWNENARRKRATVR